MPTAKTVAKPVTTAARKRAAPAAKKATPSAKPVPAASTPADPAAHAKTKLVRDSFTIPKTEYLVLESLKLRAATLARPVKKSELLRAGIKALQAMSDRALLAALGGVPSLKTGRPSRTKDVPAPTKVRK